MINEDTLVSLILNRGLKIVLANFLLLMMFQSTGICASTLSSEKFGESTGFLNQIKSIFTLKLETGKCDITPLEFAILSKNVYGSITDYSKEKNLNGWEPLSQNALNCTDCRDENSGFHGVAFTKGNTIAIVFEGTTDAPDWVQNIKHFFEIEAEQYKQAEKMVGNIISKYPNKQYVLSGHSLGGSLAEHVTANYVNQKTTFGRGPKLRAITFNSSGLNSNEFNSVIVSDAEITINNYFTIDQSKSRDIVFGFGKHYGKEEIIQVESPYINIEKQVWKSKDNALVKVAGLETIKTGNTYFKHSIDTIVEALGGKRSSQLANAENKKSVVLTPDKLNKANSEASQNTPQINSIKANSILFVLDTSDTMNQVIPGENISKIDAAKKALKGVITDVSSKSGTSAKSEYALVTYSGCDAVLTAPFTVSHSSIEQTVSGISATGRTPIAKSLEMAIDQVEKKASNESAHIILLSDGLETCGGDPVAVASRIKGSSGKSEKTDDEKEKDSWLRLPSFISNAFAAQSGVKKIAMSVIGFTIAGNSREADSLQAISNAAGGKFYTAQNVNELQSVLKQTTMEKLGLENFPKTKAISEIQQTPAKTNSRTPFLLPTLILGNIALITGIYLLLKRVEGSTRKK